MAMSDFTTVSVRKDTHKELKVVAALEGVSMDKLIRLMLKQHKAENHDSNAWKRQELARQEEPVSGLA